MKAFMKKLIKIIFVLIISTVLIYILFTFGTFCHWCLDNQFVRFVSSEERGIDIHSEKMKEKIKDIGDSVANHTEFLEEDLRLREQQELEYGSFAQYFDPLGFSVWVLIRMEIQNIVTQYLNLSIFLGIGVTIAYVVITNKRMSNIVKFLVGYIAVILIVPQILWLSDFHRLFGLFRAYYDTPNIMYFYIVYTALFVIMYVVNYKMGVKMTKELNQTINAK